MQHAEKGTKVALDETTPGPGKPPKEGLSTWGHVQGWLRLGPWHYTDDLGTVTRASVPGHRSRTDPISGQSRTFNKHIYRLREVFFLAAKNSLSRRSCAHRLEEHGGHQDKIDFSAACRYFYWVQQFFGGVYILESCQEAV